MLKALLYYPHTIYAKLLKLIKNAFIIDIMKLVLYCIPLFRRCSLLYNYTIEVEYKYYQSNAIFYYILSIYSMFIVIKDTLFPIVSTTNTISFS